MDDDPWNSPPAAAAAATAAETESAAEPATGGAPASGVPWVGLTIWMALALAVVSALQVFGSMLAGLAIGSAPFGAAYKIGYSFLTSMNEFPLGLAFIVVIGLIALPAAAGATTTPKHDRAAAVTLGLTAGFSFLLVILAILAILARLEFLSVQGQDVSPVTTRVLVTFFIRHAGTAAIAFAASLFAIRSRIDLGPVPPPQPAE